MQRHTSNVLCIEEAHSGMHLRVDKICRTASMGLLAICTCVLHQINIGVCFAAPVSSGCHDSCTPRVRLRAQSDARKSTATAKSAAACCAAHAAAAVLAGALLAEAST